MKTRVTVLGTGIMGAPMARNLLRAGLDVTVWNRSAAKAEPLASEGATVARSPAEAVAGADLVITMLSDGDAVEDVMVGKDALQAMSDGALWLQMSTVGVAATERLAELSGKAGIDFVDAPVLGTKQPAESGDLLVLASGLTSLQERCEPVFDAVGKRTMWVGEAGAGSRLKLVVNTWLIGLVGALAESVALADALGLEVDTFLDAIEGGPLDLPYAKVKGRAMIDERYPKSFTLDGARKDIGLVVEAGRDHGLELALAPVILERFDRAIAMGHGQDDMSATYAASAPRA